MIVSISRRTDIPCYYADWLINRIHSGYVMTRNPMNHRQLRRVDLSPDKVDCIVFWTKDPLRLMPFLPELDNLGYKYYFQFTLTPYGKDIEKNLRDKPNIIKTFIDLCKMNKKVIWRYDPIIINDYLTVDYHKREFYQLHEKLSPYTDTVIISYADMYRKIKSDLIKPIHPSDMIELNQYIKSVSKIAVKACCTPEFQRADCIDRRLIESIINKPLPDLKRDKHQRIGCGCYSSVDIGVYNTCPNGCVYCYANHSEKSIRKNVSKHDPNGAFLI